MTAETCRECSKVARWECDRRFYCQEHCPYYSSLPCTPYMPPEGVCCECGGRACYQAEAAFLPPLNVDELIAEARGELEDRPIVYKTLNAYFCEDHRHQYARPYFTPMKGTR